MKKNNVEKKVNIGQLSIAALRTSGKSKGAFKKELKKIVRADKNK